MEFDDPEIARDVIRLLSQELKLLRSQVQDQRTGTPSDGGSLHADRANTLEIALAAVQKDNQTLKTEILELQSQLKEGMDSKERIHQQMTINDLSRQMAEADHERTEQKNVIRDLEDKLNSSREEYRILEQEYQVVCDKLHSDEENSRHGNSEHETQVVQMIEQLSALQNKYRSVKEERRKLQLALDDFQAEFNELVEDRDEALERLRMDTEKLESMELPAVLADFPHGFLKLNEPTVNQYAPSAIHAFVKKAAFTLPKEAKELCQDGGLLHVNTMEWFWSPRGLKYGLFIQPFALFSPKAHGGIGAWELPNPSIGIGDSKDIFYRGKDVFWYYAGIYKCIYKAEITLSDASAIDTMLPNYVMTRTCLFPDFIAPAQTRMITGMYDIGSLKARVSVFEATSFNNELLNALAPKKPIAGDSMLSNSRNTTKRGAESSISDAGKGPKRKKHK